jgi:hypothetical protein
MHHEITDASRQAALAEDARYNQITPDPILPCYGAPGMADQVFNLRSLPTNMTMGFTPDHAVVERSTLRGPHGDILP